MSARTTTAASSFGALGVGGAAMQTAELLRIVGAIGINVSHDQIETLVAYVDLLQRWNGTYNLTAVRNADAILIQHLADCLAAWPSVQRNAAADTRRVLDVGSGAGLPGLVFAVLAPQWQVTCIDSVGKKAAFVRQAAAELSLPNLTSAHARVEALAPEAGLFELVTSRAFAPLSVFVGLTRRIIAPDGRWMAMKGRPPDTEMASLPRHAALFHVEPLSVPRLGAERTLIWMAPNPHFEQSVR